VVVEGVNMRKRHRRPTPDNPEGGIITFEAPIHASNVMLIDPSTGEPTRVRMRIAEGDGTTKRSRAKERISVRSGNPIPKAGAGTGRVDEHEAETEEALRGARSQPAAEAVRVREPA